MERLGEGDARKKKKKETENRRRGDVCFQCGCTKPLIECGEDRATSVNTDNALKKGMNSGNHSADASLNSLPDEGRGSQRDEKASEAQAYRKEKTKRGDKNLKKPKRP